jgi:bloom syndrome protein
MIIKNLTLSLPDYAYQDSKALVSMIRSDKNKDRPSPEDIRRQEGAIRSVVQYCQNDTECRRVQLLAFFDEIFDKRECHKSCDNCLYSGDIVTKNVTSEATKAVALVQSLQGPRGITQNYCLDVFRGSKNKDVKERKHDTHTLNGAGQHMSREEAECIFNNLIARSAFCTVSVPNAKGWHNNYLEVRIFTVSNPLVIYMVW